MSFFIDLVEATDVPRRELENLPRVQSMIHEGLDVERYRVFLHELYHIVWHFCPIMAAAASRCDDRFSELRVDLYDRLADEKGHEEWVLEDIEAVGGDVRAAREFSPPSAPTQALIGYNYYGAERLHPCSVLGMVYALEVVSSVYGGKVADSIARAQGREVDKGGFKFLSSHATMDVDHMAQLSRLMKRIVDPAAQKAIIDSTRVNFYQLGQIFLPGGPLGH